MNCIVVFTLVCLGLISVGCAKYVDEGQFLKSGYNGAEDKSLKPEKAKSTATPVLVALGVLLVVSLLAVAAVLGTVYYRRRKRGNQDIGLVDSGPKDKPTAGPVDEGPAKPVLDLRNFTESTAATPDQREPGSFPQTEGSPPAPGDVLLNPNGPLLANEETNVKLPYLTAKAGVKEQPDHPEADPTQVTSHLGTGSELNQISPAPGAPSAGAHGKAKEGKFPLAFMQRIWNEIGRLTDFSVQDDDNTKRATPTPVETKILIEKRDSDLDVESQDFKTVAIYEKQNSEGFFKQIAKKVLPQQHSNKSVSKYSVTAESSNRSTVQPSVDENSLASTELTTADSSTLKTIISDKNVDHSNSKQQEVGNSLENSRDSSTGSFTGTSVLTQSETLTSGTGYSRADDASGMDMRTVRTDSGIEELQASSLGDTQTLKNSETRGNRSSGTNTVASGALPTGTDVNVEEIASAVHVSTASLSNQQRKADGQQIERSAEVGSAQRQSAGGYPSGSSYMSDKIHLSSTQWTQTSNNIDQFRGDAEPKTLFLQTVQDFEPDPSATSSPRTSRKEKTGTGTQNDSSMSLDKQDCGENGSSTTLSTSNSASTNSIRESIPRGTLPLLNDTFQTAIGSRASSTDGDVDSDVMESGAVANSRENLFTSLALLNLSKPRRAKPRIRGVSNPRTKSLSNPCLSTTPRELSSSDDDDDGHPLASFDVTQSKLTPSAITSNRSGLKTITTSSTSKVSTANQHSRSASLSRTTTDAIWAKVLAASHGSSGSQQSFNRSKGSSTSAGSEKGTGNTRKHPVTPVVSQEFEKFSDSYHLLQSSSDKSSDEMDCSENIRTVIMKSSAAVSNTKNNNTGEDASTGSISFVPPLKRSDDDLLLKTVMANEMPEEKQKAVIFPLSVAKMVKQYTGWSSEASGAKMEKLVKESQYQNLETVESDDLQPGPDGAKHSSRVRSSQINSINRLGSSGRAKKEKSDKEETEKNKKVLQKEFPASEATYYQIANLGGFHGGNKPGEN